MTTWQILIASVFARHEQLCSLLDSLAPQLAPYGGAVSVILNRDDADMPVGMKRNQLLLAADAEWTCFLDDDDEVSGDYIERIAGVLADDIQYVGFRVRMTVDGVDQKPVSHSLRHAGWSEDGYGYYRDLSHLNPMRRTAALAGLPFNPGFGEDAAWVEKVRASGRVKAEAFIDAELYHYRYSTSGSLFKGGSRHVGVEPVLPVYEHVRVVGYSDGEPLSE